MLNANCCSVEVDKFCSPSIRKLSTVQRVACSPLEVSYLKAKYTLPLIELMSISLNSKTTSLALPDGCCGIVILGTAVQVAFEGAFAAL